MKILKKYKYIVLILILIGCDGMDNEHIVDRYYIGTIDFVENGMALYCQLDDGNYIGVINETVFAIGYNEDFIIAKQHPAKFPNPPDKSITNYFIVPIKDKVHQSPDENKIGPLTETEFIAKRKELGVPEELTFTKVLKDLE